MKILFILLSLLYSYISFGQTSLVQVKADNGFWGYADLKGNLVIPAQYKNCDPFSSNGLAVVEKDDKYTIINTKGETIPTEVQGFSIIESTFGIGAKGYANDLLGIKSGKKWGYLNAQGKIAIPLKYDFITEFDGGYAAATTGGRYLVLDTKGAETPIISADNITEIKHFSEGLAPIEAANGLYGFVNTKGETAIKPQYKSVGYFSGGFAWAKNAEGKAGFINSKGEWAIKPVYLSVTEFDTVSKFAKVKDETGWFYIDAAGNKLKVPDTESWGDFNEGLAIGDQGGKKGFYNTKGEWIIKAQYEGVRKFNNGYAAAKMNGKWGLIDATGKWVIEPKYNGMYDVVLIK